MAKLAQIPGGRRPHGFRQFPHSSRPHRGSGLQQQFRPTFLRQPISCRRVELIALQGLPACIEHIDIQTMHQDIMRFLVRAIECNQGLIKSRHQWDDMIDTRPGLGDLIAHFDDIRMIRREERGLIQLLIRGR